VVNRDGGRNFYGPFWARNLPIYGFSILGYCHAALNSSMIWGFLWRPSSTGMEMAPAAFRFIKNVLLPIKRLTVGNGFMAIQYTFSHEQHTK